MNQPSRTVAHLKMTGEFDLSNKESLSALLLQGESADDVIIDMSGTTYVDSTALHCLIALKKHLTARGGGAIRLVGVHSGIRKVFAITGLDSLFEISGQVEAG